MTLPPVLESAFSEFSLEHLLVLFMLAASLLLVAIAFERAFFLWRVRRSLGGAERLLTAARTGTAADTRQSGAALKGPARAVFAAGLQRASGELRGNPLRGMLREHKRLGAAMRSRTWILATAGALMPFVGLFGTVLGVMSSFQAIGESGQGGFAVVSVGISQALIATAVGIAVALEGVVLFNMLQNSISKLSREAGLLVDELAELLEPMLPAEGKGGADAGGSQE